MAGGHGGYRPGAGRKPDDYEPTEDEASLNALKREHEQVKINERAFKLAREQGEYLPREAVRQAAATALAVLTQSVRSIPDNLERTLSLPPATVEAVALQIDQALSEAAASFKAMAGDAA